jgi:hypothetical protein
MFEPSPVLLPQRTGPAATGAGDSGADDSGADDSGAGDASAEPPGAGTRGATSPLEEHLRSELRGWWRAARPAWVADDWYDAPVRPEVRALMTLEPGPVLVAAVHAVATGSCPAPHAGEALPGAPAPGQVAGSPCACQLVVAAAWEACASWVAARGARSTVDVAGPNLVEHRTATGQTVVDPAREELALVLSISPTSAHNRIMAARELLSHPGLVALVESGACSPWAARVIVLEVASLPVGDAREVVADVVDRIRHRHLSGRRRWAPAELRRATRSARLRAHPDSEEQSRRSAWESRRVEILPGPPGMTVLQAAVAETDALRIHRRLTAIARGLDDDGRTLDQRRADLLVDSLLDAGRDRASTPHTPGPSSPESAPSPDDARPEICVIVGLDTLLGLVDGAADVPGLGQVPAGVARALAADGRWRAWITDAAGSAIAPASAGAPASAVVATGSQRYTPGPALARLVRAREVVCRMPGCQRPAGTCDLDHTVPWPHGETVASNLGPLCRRHHQLKTHCGWRLESTDLGWRWRLPSGLTQHDHADPPLE